MVGNETKKYEKKEWNAEVLNIEVCQRFKELRPCGLVLLQKQENKIIVTLSPEI